MTILSVRASMLHDFKFVDLQNKTLQVSDSFFTSELHKSGIVLSVYDPLLFTKQPLVKSVVTRIDVQNNTCSSI